MQDSKYKPDSSFVRISTPARLHLGFLDINGGLDRKFGSLGMAINQIETSLIATYADDVEIYGPCDKKASDYAEQVLSHYGINGGIRMNIVSTIPEHAGLGSGTQLSLAVATAISTLYDLNELPEALAATLHRGARSGIGVGTFQYGGFIVDGGRGPYTQVPPVISHISFPEHWRIILVFDEGSEGINGVPERRAFNTLPPMDENDSGLLCRLTMMKVLPALAEEDCECFGEAITQIQNLVGDYFAQAQGGRFSSPFMHKILNDLQDSGSTGSGQSSWGPTGFAFFRDETAAFNALKKIRKVWNHEQRIRFMIVAPQNEKASITQSSSVDELKQLTIQNQFKNINIIS